MGRVVRAPRTFPQVCASPEPWRCWTARLLAWSDADAGAVPARHVLLEPVIEPEGHAAVLSPVAELKVAEDAATFSSWLTKRITPLVCSQLAQRIAQLVSCSI